MPTYAENREKLFLAKLPNSSTMQRKRSDGRLKAYNSATDVRCWSNDVQRQREYILEKMNNADTSYGNYVPFLELLDVLGLRDNAELLNETVGKLTIINDILRSKDTSDGLTKSEEALKSTAIRQGAAPEDVDDETVRNLRHLVKDLIEQHKYYTSVKEENEELKKTMSEQSQLMGNQVDELNYQKNILQERVNALEGIEAKVEDMKKQLDRSKITIRQLRKQLDEFPNAEELRQLKEKASENVRLKHENNQMRAKLFKMRRMSKEMEKDNDSLRSSLVDLEDEMKKLEEATGGRVEERRVPEVEGLSPLESETRNDVQIRSLSVSEISPRETEEPQTRDGMEESEVGAGIEESEMGALPKRNSKLNQNPDVDSASSPGRDLSEEPQPAPPGRSQSATKELIDAQNRCSHFEELLARTEAELNDKISDLDDANKQRKELENELIILQDANKALLEKLQVALDETKKATEDALQELQQARADLERASAERDALQMQIENLKESALQTGSDLDKLKEYAVDRDMVKDKVKELEKELLDKQREIDLLKDKLASAEDKTVIDQENQKLKDRIQEMEKTLESSHQLGDELQAKLKAAQDEAEALKARESVSEKPIAQDDPKKVMEEMKKAEEESIRQRKYNEALEEKERNQADLHNALDQLRGLRNDLMVLQKEYDELKEDRNDLQQQLQKLREVLGDLEDKLNREKVEANEAKKQLNALQDQTGQSKLNLQTAIAENDKLKLTLNNNVEEQDALRNKTRVLEDALAAKEKYINDLQAKIKDLEGMLSTANKNLENASTKNGELSEVADNLNNQLVDAKKELGALKESEEKLKHELVKTNGSLKNANENLGEGENERAVLLNQLKELKDQTAAKIQDLNNQIEGRDKAIEDLKRQCAALEKDLEMTKKDVNTLRDNLAIEKRKTDEVLDSLKKEQEKNVQLDKKLEDTESKNLKLSEEIMKNEEKLQDALKNLKGLKKSTDDAEKAIAEKLRATEEDAINANKKLKLAESALNDTMVQLNDANNKVDKFEKQCASLKKELSLAKEEAGLASNDRDNLTSHMAKELNNANNLAATLKRAESKTKELEENVGRLNADLKQCHDELSKCRTRIVELENENEGLNRIKYAVEAELKDKNDKLITQGDSIKNNSTAMGKMQENLEGIQAEKNILEQEKRGLQNELEENIKKLANFEEKVKKLTDELQKSLIDNKKCTELQELVNQLRKESEESKAELARLNTSNDKLNNDFRTVTKAKEDLEEKLKESLREQSDLKRRQKTAYDKLLDNKEQKDKLLKMNEEADKLARDLSSTSAALKAAQEKAKALDDDSTRLKTSLAKEKAGGEVLQKKLGDTEDALQQLKDKCSAQESELNRALNDCRKMLAETTTKLAAMKKEVGDLVNENTKLVQDKKAMEDKFKADLENTLLKLADKEKVLEKFRMDGSEKNRDNTELRDMVDKLKTELASMKKERDDLVPLKDDKRVLQNALEDCKSKLAIEKEQIVMLKKQLSSKEEELVLWKKQTSEIEEALKNALAAVEKIREDLDQAKLEAAILRDENGKLTTQLVGWKDGMKSLEEHSSYLEGKMETVRETSKGQLDKLLNEIRDKEALLKEGENKICMLEELQARALKEAHKLKEELETEQTATRKFQNELQKALNHISTLTKSFQELESQKDTYKAENDELHLQVNKLEEIEMIKDQFNSVKRELADKTCEADALAKELKELVKQIKKSHREHNKLKQLLTEERVEKDKALEKAIMYEEKANALEVEGRVCSDKLIDVELENNIMKKQLNETENELNRLKDAGWEHEKTIDNLRRKIEKLDEEIQYGKQVCDAQTKKSAELKEDNDNLKNRVHKMAEVIEELKRKIGHMEMEHTLAEDAMGELRAALDESHRKLSAAEQANEVLKTQISSQEANIAANKVIIDKLHNQVDSLLKVKNDLEEQWQVILGKYHDLKRDKDDLERVQIESENLTSELQSKLQCEKTHAKRQLAEINDLKAQVKVLTDQLGELEEAREDLFMEKENLMTDLADLKAELMEIKGFKSFDTSLNRILQKILKFGSMRELTMEELAELHNATSEATSKLIELEKAKLADKAPVVKLGPTLTSLPEQKKAILKKTVILQNEVNKRQIEAKKRTCALTQAIQQYQRELASLRVWDHNLEMAIAERSPEGQARRTMLKAQAELKASQISHCICMAENEKHRALELEAQLQKALESVRNVQQNILSPGAQQNSTNLDMQNSVIESLKGELKKSVVTERLLAKLLNDEKEKVSALEFHLKLADDKEKERLQKGEVNKVTSGPKVIERSSSGEFKGQGDSTPTNNTPSGV